ncbi:MAG: hypothetical protein Q8Q35_01330 [Nanoarchaeota archaeon]|nr:hypothetical protein [Nanoarchaeota archaeon]
MHDISIQADCLNDADHSLFETRAKNYVHSIANSFNFDKVTMLISIDQTLEKTHSMKGNILSLCSPERLESLSPHKESQYYAIVYSAIVSYFMKLLENENQKVEYCTEKAL